MVVAVCAVRVMQVAVDEVVGVVAVRNGLVTAGRAVDVRDVVAAAGVRRRAGIRVGRAHCDDVLVDVRLVQVVQVAVVQVVGRSGLW